MTDLADDEILPCRWRRLTRTWVLVAGITALAAVLRTLALKEIPPGLYHDEAHNGLDALRVLRGEWPIYFAANRGREPLFIYLIAATVGLLGRTPGALRLTAAFCGTLTIPTTYLMTRAWFDRRLISPSSGTSERRASDQGVGSSHRIAVLSAAIMAIILWHVHLSRVGFRAVTLPLTTALTLWLAARALRSSRRRDWLLTGFLYGLSFYTYIPARITPCVLLAFTLYLLFTGQGSRLWPGGLYLAAGTSMALAPLAVYAVGHWETLMGRPGQVSVFNPLINGGDLWSTLGRQLLAVLGMFFVRGDAIPRHNLPGRPVFDPLLGAATVVGVIRAVVHARRRDAASALALIWVGLMLVPTWLAEDAPHFLRAVGILPLLSIFPALGLDAAQGWLERDGKNGWAVALPCVVLVIALGLTGWHYFVRYRADAQVGYAFEEAAVELAAEANRFIGVGWDGSGIAAPESEPRRERQVYVDDRLWDEWAAIPFLIPETEGVTRFSPNAPPAPTGAALLLVWPHDGVRHYVDALPRRVAIEARPGPLTRGDLEEAPYRAYVAYKIEPRIKQSTEYLARFGDQIALIDYEIGYEAVAQKSPRCIGMSFISSLLADVPSAIAGRHVWREQSGVTFAPVRREAEQDHQTWEARLSWEALTSPTKNYTVFVYLYDDGRLVAQDDAEPGDGYYPTSMWRGGDVVIDSHVLELSGEPVSDPRLVVGMYAWPTMERLRAESPTGRSLGNQVTLPIER